MKRSADNYEICPRGAIDGDKPPAPMALRYIQVDGKPEGICELYGLFDVVTPTKSKGSQSYTSSPTWVKYYPPHSDITDQRITYGEVSHDGGKTWVVEYDPPKPPERPVVASPVTPAPTRVASMVSRASQIFKGREK